MQPGWGISQPRPNLGLWCLVLAPRRASNLLEQRRMLVCEDTAVSHEPWTFQVHSFNIHHASVVLYARSVNDASYDLTLPCDRPRVPTRLHHLFWKSLVSFATVGPLPKPECHRLTRKEHPSPFWSLGLIYHSRAALRVGCEEASEPQ